MQKKEVGPLYLTLYKNINSKGIKDLNIRAKIIKLLGKKRHKSCDLKDSGLAMTSKVQATTKNKDIIKIKTFCTSKDTIKKLKRQLNEKNCLQIKILIRTYD